MTKQLSIFCICLILLCSHIAFPQSNSCYYPVVRQTKMNWGVNGHPATQEAYLNYSGNYDSIITRNKIIQQINSLKNFNLDYYRFDLEMNKGTFSTRYPYRFNENDIIVLLQRLSANGVKPVVVLKVVGDRSLGPDINDTEYANYTNGITYGTLVARKIGKYVQYYELDNELDGYLQKFYGCDESTYNTDEIKKASAYLKGLNVGLKSVDFDAKTIIDISCDCRYFFFKMLRDYQLSFQTCLPSSISDFDIMGLHSYGSSGDLNNMRPNTILASTPVNILKELDNIYPDKDIWITEFDNIQVDDNTRATWLKKNLKIANDFKGIRGTEKVKAIMFYELYDELADKDPSARYYGLCSCTDNSCLTPTPKQVLYDAIRSSMKELNTDYLPFITSIYGTIYCGLDPIGINNWATYFRTTDKKTALKVFLNEAWIPIYVRTANQNLFNHTPDPGGVQSSITQLKTQSGYKLEDFLTDKIQSDEFWSIANGNTTTNPPINYSTITTVQIDNFLKRLYQRVLGRDYDNAGLISARDILMNSSVANRPAIHRQIIQNFIYSKEYIDNYITNLSYTLFRDEKFVYNTFGLYYHTNMYNKSMSQLDVLIELFCTKNYWDLAMKRAYECERDGCNYTTETAVTFRSPVDASWMGILPNKPAYYFYINNNHCRVRDIISNSLLRENSEIREIEEPIYNQSGTNDFIIFPNPSEGIYYIIPEGIDLNSISKIEIISTSGQVKNIDFIFRNDSIEFDGSKLGKGIYILSLESANLRVTKRLFR